MKKNNKPAFPTGMSLREYFAGLAMQGFITNKNKIVENFMAYEDVAKESIKMADILIEALK